MGDAKLRFLLRLFGAAGVLLEVFFNLLFSFKGTFDLLGRDCLFFGYSMREDYDGSATEKIENPIMDSLVTGAKFIDPISQEVGFWTAKFIAERGEAADSVDAFEACLDGYPVQPLEQRDFTRTLSVEMDIGTRHPLPVSMFSFLRTMFKGWHSGRTVEDNLR